MHDIRWVINLGNSICGVALLVLPYCFSQCGVVLGAILLLFSAILTTWSCHLLLENVFACKVASYEGVAKELYGKSGKLLVEISATTLNIGCCSAFFVIISDLSPGVISWVTGTSSIDPNLHLVILTSLGLTIILPLSMIRNLEPLNYVSLASLTFYISLTVQLFLWAIKNGSDSKGGFASNLKIFDYNGIFHVLPIYALGFSCHLQLMAMTREVVGDVKDGMGTELTRMKWISKGAVSIVAILYGSVSLFGHIAFCENGVEADVLSNFNHGSVAQITRFGFAVSVLLSFPFMVNPCRAALYSLIYKRTDKMIPIQKHFILTFSIVFTAFFIAVTTPNVAVVVALTGAISGAVICYLFPAVSYLYNSKIKHTNKQRIRAWILICVGVILLTLGTMSALSSSSTSPQKNVDVVSNPEVPHSNLVEDHKAGGAVGGAGGGEVNPADLMGLLKTDKNILSEKGKDEGKDNKDVGRGDQLVIPGVVKPPGSDSMLLTGVGETLTGVARTLQEDKGKADKEEGVPDMQDGGGEKEQLKRGEEEQKQDKDGDGIAKEHAEDNKEQERVNNEEQEGINNKEQEGVNNKELEGVNSKEQEGVDDKEQEGVDDKEQEDPVSSEEQKDVDAKEKEGVNVSNSDQRVQHMDSEESQHTKLSEVVEAEKDDGNDGDLTKQEDTGDDIVGEQPAPTPLQQATARPDTMDFIEKQLVDEGDMDKDPVKRGIEPNLNFDSSSKPDLHKKAKGKHKVQDTRANGSNKLYKSV